jgi:hypothetical protein
MDPASLLSGCWDRTTIRLTPQKAADLGVAPVSPTRSLTATVPCCGAVLSLADLDYDWPAGFSRFRITLWNPEHELTDEHLATLSMTLGHELCLIHAHP